MSCNKQLHLRITEPLILVPFWEAVFSFTYASLSAITSNDPCYVYTIPQSTIIIFTPPPEGTQPCELCTVQDYNSCKATDIILTSCLPSLRAGMSARVPRDPGNPNTNTVSLHHTLTFCPFVCHCWCWCWAGNTQKHSDSVLNRETFPTPVISIIVEGYHSYIVPVPPGELHYFYWQKPDQVRPWETIKMWHMICVVQLSKCSKYIL